MAVITSDSDLNFFVAIRLIGSHTSCMQFACRVCPSILCT
jgi:hypothetical protein